jgi:hypothetical protein
VEPGTNKGGGGRGGGCVRRVHAGSRLEKARNKQRRGCQLKKIITMATARPCNCYSRGVRCVNRPSPNK